MIARERKIGSKRELCNVFLLLWVDVCFMVSGFFGVLYEKLMLNVYYLEIIGMPHYRKERQMTHFFLYDYINEFRSGFYYYVLI